jgi:beta-glucosidase
MDYKAKASNLLKQMSLEEKAGLLSGKNFWQLKGVERLGLKPVMITDGPHGLRKQEGNSDHLGLNKSVPATSFPTASATACSFDPELLHRMGQALGEKCISEEVAAILGPGVNIKRSPLCGRNFEYFSEDPYLAGEMSAALIQGIQSMEVGTSLKHYAVNNQESSRMTVDSQVDERALREIYLAGFEAAVKKAKPWTVMASYNKVNGTYACDNSYLLTDILRKEWGYDGIVVSDWGAVNDRVGNVRAGMDLEMPGTGADSDLEVVEAVKNGTLSMAEVDLCAQRVLEFILKSMKEKPASKNGNQEHHKLAREIAAKSAVLLKNEASILPICPTAKVAVIGEMARTPRYQGAGSSRINPAFLDNAFDALQEAGVTLSYRPGYRLGTKAVDHTMIEEACSLAKESDVVLVFAGLPDEYESEGFDRTTLFMPESHNRLIEAVAKANPNTVVILQLGAPVVMPWKDRVKGILLMYLAGQAGGGATADLLLGKVNPSGKLAETFPKALEDNSSFAYFPGTSKSVQYRESIYIGYRYYDKVKKEAAYPFGYGLSYTSFEYNNLQVEKLDSLHYKVSVDVTNTGKESGAEIVQLYVHCNSSSIFRAEKELKGFAKLFLEPGETKKAQMLLDERSFAYYNTAAKNWCVEGGAYQLLIAASSADIRLTAEISLAGDGKEALLADLYQPLSQYRTPGFPLKISDEQYFRLLGYTPKPDTFGKPYTKDSTMGDIKDTAVGKLLNAAAKGAMKKMMKDNSDPTMILLMERAAMEAPLRSMKMVGGLTNKKVQGLVDLANGQVIKGVKNMLNK